VEKDSKKRKTGTVETPEVVESDAPLHEASDTTTPRVWDDEQGWRHVYIEALGPIKMRLPSLAIQAQADQEYARFYFQLLQEKAPTRREMLDLLKSRNLLHPEAGKRDEYVERLRRIQSEIQELATDDPRRNTLLEESAKIQAVLLEIQQREEEFLAYTAERQADNHRLIYLATLCVVHDDDQNTPLWHGVQEFMEDTRSAVVTAVITHFTALLYGVSADVMGA